MDPNERLQKLVHCIENGWLDEAAEHHYSLMEWLNSDGFDPDAFIRFRELERCFYAGFDDFCHLIEDAPESYSEKIKAI